MDATPLVTAIPEAEPQLQTEAPIPINIPLPETQKREENPLENSPFAHYFNQLDSHHTLLQVNSKYSKALQQKLQEQIRQGAVKVRTKKKHFQLNKESQPTEEEKLRLQKQKLETKKREAVQQLNELNSKEREWLLQNSSLMRSRNRRSMTVLEGPDDWLKEIRTAIKKHRNFKRSLDQKNREVVEKEQSFKQQALNERLRFLQKMKEEHNRQTKKKREVHEKDKERQSEMQKQCQQLVQKIRPRKYVHQRVVEQEQIKALEKEQERNLKLEDFVRRRQIEDWDDIREHQERYYDFLEERKESWIGQFNQMKEQHRSRLKQYKGFYAQKAKDEEHALKEYAIQEEEKGLKMLQKIKGYNQYVSEHFKPTKLKKNSLNPETLSSQRRKDLDRSQQRLKGIEYLTQAKETVKSCKILPRSTQFKGKEGKGNSLPKIKSQTAYKNYLKDQPVRKKQGTDVDQFQAALTKRRGTWAQSALSLISRMETNDHSRGDRPMISSAFNKIQLLKAMY